MAGAASPATARRTERPTGRARDTAALTATGGLLLVGISLRLLRVREIPVGDLLPALIVAPLLTQLVVMLR